MATPFKIHNSLSTSAGSDSHHHAHSHDHANEHGHTHEHMETPGSYLHRDHPLANRNFSERAFTVGIGGPVGSGKTALMLALCQHLHPRYNIAAVTNDIFTKEDAEFLIRNKALPAERIRAVETGGCPHAGNIKLAKLLEKILVPT